MQKNLNLDELCRLFQEKGIVLDEDKIKYAKQKIKAIGYYKLKALAIPYEKVVYTNLTFDQLVNRFYQDKNLRIAIFHAIESIEVFLNRIVSTILGSDKLGPFGYLKFSNWCDIDSFNKDKILHKQEDFQKTLLKKVNRSNLPDFKKKKNKNKDGFPTIWLMTDCLTLGDTIRLIKIMSKDNFIKIEKEFNLAKNDKLNKSLKSWLYCLNFIRNQCAHNESLVDIYLKTAPKQVYAYKDYYNDEKTIASVIFIIKYLISKIEPDYNFEGIYNPLKSIINNDKQNAQMLGFENVEAIEKIL